MEINEIFTSIQGEGSLAGTPCIFVRFQGCNLNCSYCDTPQAKEHKQVITLSSEELVRTLRNFEGYTTVVLTGGEPMQQLTKRLVLDLKQFYNIIIQTNGTLPMDEINSVLEMDDLICCDVKCNAANFMQQFITVYKNVRHILENVEFKVPVYSIADALSIDKQFGLLKDCFDFEETKVYVSPIIKEGEDIKETYKKFVELDINNLQHTKLNFQIHKLIGVK